jgi:hypothetical protein
MQYPLDPPRRDVARPASDVKDLYRQERQGRQ